MIKEFIEKAKLIHGDKYDYSLVDYINTNTKIIIICKEHGEFTQTPKQHLKGSGCCKCSIILRSNKRKTPIEEFIKKCKEKHGDKYDYSKVDYKNTNTKIIIICKEHGEFKQIPNNHLFGLGCSKCGGTAKSNTEEFIEKAKSIHGDLYDYSKVDYKNNITKVIILCKEHGEYQQTPKCHLIGNGCGKCSGTAKSNTEEFIKKAKSIHSGKYDYSNVDYKNSITNIIIICKIHGEFTQTPKCHLQGHGCYKCSIIAIKSKSKTPIEEFIKKCKEKHGDKYDYSKVDYINCDTKIIIICKEHGEFQQTPWCHLKSNGCCKCSGHYTMTKEEFIKRSKNIHGDLYDYSKVNYIDTNTGVIIICKIHGEFIQKPVYHYWNKSGCPKCGGNAKSNTEEFIEKAKLIHKDKYDYSKTEYLLSNKQVIIICKIHGEFNQIASYHLGGSGCQKCANKYTMTTNEFIEKSKLVHGNKYDYSKVDYINTDIKVLILCKKHGEFQQIPTDHLRGHDCLKCYQSTISERMLQTTEEFIERSKNIHGDLYDYSKVDYKYSNEKVIIICKIHGEFLQTFTSHYHSRSGCQKCAGVAKLTTEDFIERSKKKHGNLYDYSLANYTNNSTKVLIICKKHGEFYQNPGSHYISGSGCPKCCNINYSTMQILWLNFLSRFYNIYIQHALNDGEFLIPNTNYKADGYCKETNTIYEFHGDFWHGNPKIYNQDKINTKTNCSFKELYEKTLIKENKIKELGYNLVIIWEKDWKKINNAVRIIQRKFLIYKK